MANKFNTKYAVRLAPLQSSFFDPESGCNLFRSTPVYAFNHEPTRNIKESVKHGSLVDLIGNVLGEKEVVETVAPSPAEAKTVVEDKVDAKVEAAAEDKATNKATAKGGKAKEKTDNAEAEK